jgi:hypothetical protein
MGTLPNLIIIGSPKCGTTSLHYYLGLHPEIFMSRTKELRFFIEERNWRRGVEWYKSQFRTRRQVSIWGEASPGYTHYPRFLGVPQRMHSVVPQARLIQIVRDPMKRLLSHYVQWLDQGRIKGDINQEAERFVMASRQCFQLEQYLPYYPLERILIFTQEEMARDRAETLRRVFRFLMVDDSYQSPEFLRRLNVGESKRARNPIGRALAKAIEYSGVGPRLPAKVGTPIRKALLRPFSRPVGGMVLGRELEQRLLEIFREDVERLRRLTGMKFEGWCV